VIRRHAKALSIVALVVLVAVLYETGVIPHLPDAKKVIEDVAEGLGSWTYALVGLLAFLETGAFVGLIAPGETAIIGAGVIAGQGQIELLPLIGLVWLCAASGDTTTFLIGRRLGRGFILKHGPRFKITEDRLESVEAYFERHGGKTILIGRFVGFVRPIAPFVAGSSGFPYRRFLPFSVIGCGLWGTTFCVLGYVFWRSFDQVTAVAGKATLAFGIVVAVAVGIVVAVRRLRDPEQRRRIQAWMEKRPALAPLARAAAGLGRLLGPRLRFLGQRLTPGDLGLEMTTTIAAAGVGLYVFVLYANVIEGGRRLTPADRSFMDMAHRLVTPVATDVVKVVTELGSFPIVAVLLAVTCVVLATHDHRLEMVSLLTGAVVLYVALHLAKAGIDRPRPPMPLVHAEGSSFPSGHAAYSTVWVAVAVVIARALPGLGSRAVLVGIGTAICVAVGLSRIYLGVHYWSDVAAGWALGAAALGACAAVGLVVDYIRNNEPGRAPRSPVS
jgi:membrane protein DedA with SNARE-associated domain